MTSVLFILSVNPFLKFQILSWRLNTFSQVSGVAPIGFTIFFVRGGCGLFHLFLFFLVLRMVLKQCSSSLCECNACTVRFF